MATTLRFNIVARDKASRVFDNIGRKSGLLGRNLGTFGTVAVGALKGAGLALGALGVVAGKTGLQTAAGLQRAEVAFETLLGSGEKARAFLEDLRAFSVRTPFELAGLTQTATQLLGVGVEANRVIPILRNLGDTSAAFGLSQAQFEGVLRGVTQAMAKGRIQAEELLQISEAGIPIYTQLSKALGLPIPEILKLSKQGELLAEDVFPKLFKQMQKDYGGTMSRQMATLTGVWNLLTESFRLGAADAIQPLIPLLTRAVPAAAQFTLDAFHNMRGGIKGFVRFVEDAATAIQDFFDGLTGADVPSAAELMEHVFVPDRSAAGELGRKLREFFTSVINDAFERLDFKSLGRRLGKGLGEAIEFLAESASEISDKIGDALGKVDWFDVGKDVGSGAIGFGLGFVAGLGEGDLFTLDFWEEHFVDVILAALGGAILGKFAGGVAKIVEQIPVLKMFSGLFRGIDNLTKPLQTAVFGALRAVGRAVSFGIREIVNGVGSIFGKAKLGDDVMRWLAAIPTGIGVTAIRVFEKGKDLVRGFGRGISSGAGFVFRSIGKLIGQVLRAFGGAGKWLLKSGGALIAGFVAGAIKAWQNAQEWLRDRKARVQNALRNSGDWLKRAGGRLISGFFGAILKAWDRVRDWLSGTRERFQDRFSRAGEWLKGAGSRLIGGLIGGIRSRARDAVDAARGVVNNAIQAARNLLGIGSDSKVFAKIGMQTIGGYAEGIGKGLDDFSRQLPAALAHGGARLGRNATLAPPGTPVVGAGGGIVLNVTFTGPVGSQYELRNWLVRTIDDLNRSGRLRGVTI